MIRRVTGGRLSGTGRHEIPPDYLFCPGPVHNRDCKREFARHRYRQSQLVGLTREQLTAIARDAQRQRAGATRGEELAALVVELAQQRVVPAAERHGG